MISKIKDVVIWEIILQEIKVFISRKYFSVLTFSAMVSKIFEEYEIRSSSAEFDAHVNTCTLPFRKTGLNRQNPLLFLKFCDWRDKQPC